MATTVAGITIYSKAELETEAKQAFRLERKTGLAEHGPNGWKYLGWNLHVGPSHVTLSVQIQRPDGWRFSHNMVV